MTGSGSESSRLAGFRIGTPHLRSGAVHGEEPGDSRSSGVATVLPRGDFGAKRCAILDTSVEALTFEYANFAHPRRSTVMLALLGQPPE